MSISKYPEHVNLMINYKDKANCYYKIRRDTSLGRAFSTFCARNLLNTDKVVFKFNDVVIDPLKDANYYRLSNSDVIECFDGVSSFNYSDVRFKDAPQKPVSKTFHDYVDIGIGNDVNNPMCYFRILRTQPLREAFLTFCTRYSIEPNGVIFKFRDTIIDFEKTPNDYNFSSQCVITCS